MSVENYKYAPYQFGAYLKEIAPFRESTPSSFFFRSVNDLPDNSIFLLDAAGGNGKRYGSGLLYLSKTPNHRLSYVINDLVPESLREFNAEIIPLLPDNTHYLPHVADLRQTWSYPDSRFNAVMMTWALHWLGKYHQHAVKEMVRVLKPDGLGFIATFTPYDVIIKNQVFPKTIPLENLKRMFPEADEIIESVTSLQGRPVWIVKFDSSISDELQKNPDFIIVEKHPASGVGKKTMVGFNPSYLPNLLEKEGCETILYQRARNIDFPNGYTEGDRDNTLLYYVFRKKS